MNKELMIIEGATWGQPDCPRDLKAAAGVLERQLHRLLARSPHAGTVPNSSRFRCVWACLTAADALRGMGFDATASAALLHIAAFDGRGELIHGLGVGFPDPDPAVVALHMAVRIATKDGSWLLDPTMHQVRRAQWPSLPSMCLVPVRNEGDAPELFHHYQDHPALAQFGLARETQSGTERLFVTWYPDPDNFKWVVAPDAKPERRARVVQKLLVEWRKARC